MKLGTYVCVAINELRRRNISIGKTNIQKMIYFALPEENRDQYYLPYYYGPYSTDVQQTVASLLRKEGVENLGQLPDVKKDFCYPEEDEIVRRLGTTAVFLREKKITSAGAISFLAKVHLLRNSKREEASTNPVQYIKNQARFLGWKEPAQASQEKIQEHIFLAGELEEALSN